MLNFGLITKFLLQLLLPSSLCSCWPYTNYFSSSCFFFLSVLIVIVSNFEYFSDVLPPVFSYIHWLYGFFMKFETSFSIRSYNNPIASISFLQTGCFCLHSVLIHHLLQELNFRLLALNLYLEVNITCVFCWSSTYNNCNKVFFNFLFAMLYLFCTSLIGSKKMLGSSSFFMTVLFTICLVSSANGGVRLWVVFHHKMCQSFWPPHASFCDNAMESLLATTFSFLLLESGLLVVCILQKFWILKNPYHKCLSIFLN